MKKIEDAPELKAAFSKAANDFGLSDHEFSRGIAESNYMKYRGKCKEMAEQAAAKDITLTVVRGHYYCPIWNRREPHWWCVKPDGEIVDPSALQFPSGNTGLGEYEPFLGFLSCSECGKTIHENEISPISSGSHPVCSYECYGRLVGVIR